METSIHKGIVDQIMGLKPFVLEEKANPLTGAPAKSTEIKRALTFGELLAFSVEDSNKREIISNYAMAPLLKQLRSTDVSGLLAASFYPIMASLANRDTTTYDLLRSSRTPVPVRDWQVDIPEERIGTATAPAWHPDGTSPAEVNGLRTIKQNTLMFIGNRYREGIVTADMLKQQRNIDSMGREMVLESIRIKSSANIYLLKGVRQANYAYTNIPQCDGIYTDSKLSIFDCGGGDLSEAGINAILDDIAAYMGRNFQLVALTNSNQMTTVRNLETGRWGISTPSTERNEYQQMMPESLRNVKNLMFQRWFVPANGNPIPFLYEKDLPAGATLFLVYDMPDGEQCIGEFELAGQPGPWTLARQSEDAVNLVISFYGFTGIFPMQEGKAKAINHR